MSDVKSRVHRDAIERAILELAARRGAGKTICPSEVARFLAPENWRPLMEEVRSAAAGLADAGDIVVTQGGEIVDARGARGAIRLGLVTDEQP